MSLALVASVVAACAAPSSTPTSAPAASTSSPVPGGRIIANGKITTLSPVIAAADPQAATPSVLATMLLYERLIRVHPTSIEPEPGLARWTIAPDGRTYTWRIAPTARWTDGRPVIAADFLTGLQALAKSKVAARHASRLVEIEGYRAYLDGISADVIGVTLDPADPKSMTVRLEKSSCPALVNVFGEAFVLPTHVFGKYVSPGSGDAIDRAPENDSAKVTNGPFMLGEWRRGDELRLTRNPAYWRGAPLLEEYVFREGTAPADELRRGAINFLGVGEPVEIPGSITTYRTTGSGYQYIGWNTRSETAPALRDKRIRQALAYGLDWDQLLRDVVKDGTRVFSHHLPTSWAHPSGLNEYRYDKARAEALIASASYAKGADGIARKDGRPLAITITTNDNPTRKAILQLAATQYREIGVIVTPKIVGFEDLTRALTEGDPSIEAWILGLSHGEDPDPFSAWHSSAQADPRTGRKNAAGLMPFTAPGIDEAIEGGRDGPDCSIARRKEHYAAFDRILNEEQPLAFGYTTPKRLAGPVGLQDFSLASTVLSTGYDIHRWWIKK